MCLFKKDDQNTNCEHPECKTVHLLAKSSHGITNHDQLPNFLPNLRPGMAMNPTLFNQHTISKILERKQGVAPQPFSFMPDVQLPAPNALFNQALFTKRPNEGNYTMTDTLNSLINGSGLKMKPPQNVVSSHEEQRQMDGMINASTEARLQMMDNTMKEFQQKVFSALSMQNLLISEIKEGNSLLHSRMNQLTDEINVLRKNFPQHGIAGSIGIPEMIQIDPKPIDQSQKIFQNYGVSQSTTSSDQLIQYIFGQKGFNYQLRLGSDFPKVIYRERNFGFRATLTDMNGNPIENINKVPLSVALYTCECPPKFIDTNTSG
eukprot:TRINITY_DN3317_c0_g1_i4.p1 TRINITY_DN3317_c0_g1~~TRINITY_DN3317_c0_g1_i4.p1  ORF type:complete len:319 (+),score=50.78 TRINITY_DN3317_c0_g1_i4:109-1065(+)